MNQGSATSTTPGNLTEDQARLKLQGLQHEVERSANLARWMGRLAVLLIVLLIALSVSIYLYYVMQYASVSTVEAVAAAGRPGSVEIAYTPLSEGKVEFVRESAGFVQILTEYVTSPSSERPQGKFTWSGKERENPSFRATYRRGLFLVTQDLPPARAGAAPGQPGS